MVSKKDLSSHFFFLRTNLAEIKFIVEICKLKMIDFPEIQIYGEKEEDKVKVQFGV